MRILLFFTFICLMVSNLTYAGHKITMKEGDLLLDFYVDKKGYVEIVGLPEEGRFVYDSNTGRFYIQPFNGGQSYYVRTPELENHVAQADVISTAFAETGMMFGFDTKRWNVSVYNEYCNAVDASPQMTNVIGLTLKDMKRIGLAVGYVFAQDMNAQKCSFHGVAASSAQLVGFPMKIYETKNGIETKVITFVEDPTFELLKVPENAKYLDNDAYIVFLKKRLNRMALSSFLKSEKQLSSAKLKVKALKRLLEQPENRKGFYIPEVSKGNVYGGPRSQSEVIRAADR